MGLMAHSKGQRGSETMLAFLHAGQGQCTCTPDCVPLAHRVLRSMLVGRGFTAVARQVPRLAGLVRFPEGYIGKTGK